MSDPRRIVVFSPNWLGDAVMALPAMQDVRRRWPSARLIVAARPSVAGVFALVPWVDDVVTLRWRGQLFQRATLTADAEALRGVAADAAILLTNSFATAWLARAAAIAERWGYATDLRSRLLTRAVRRPTRSVHQAAYYQHLTTSLGIDPGPLEPGLSVDEETLEAARSMLRPHGWNRTRRLVVLAPGAAYGTAKRWLPVHFAELVTRLTRERDVHCVLVGSAGDAETMTMILEALDRDVRARTIDLTGQTTLVTLTGILALADTCVSNDSGAMHLAAAAGAPVAALFGPTRDRETAPLARAARRTDVLVNPVWCRPCMLRECPIDHRCMRGLSPARVFTAVTSLMEHRS